MLVTLEGIDGSGKTTVWERLQEDFGHRKDLVFTREPTDSTFGDQIHDALADDETPALTELFMFMADHAKHLEETVWPALEAGKTVISDRYIDSRIAYQAVSLPPSESDGDPTEFVRELHRPWSAFPDATLLFDICPDIAAERSAGENRFEDHLFLAAVNARYQQRQRKESDRYHQIHAAGSKDDVYRQVVATLRQIGALESDDYVGQPPEDDTRIDGSGAEVDSGEPAPDLGVPDRRVRCPNCEGRGTDPESDWRGNRCGKCVGKGHVPEFTVVKRGDDQ